MDWNIDDSIRRLAPEMVSLRRDFHQHPEIYFQERRTAGIIAQKLEQWGYEVKTGIGKTGVIGVLRGSEFGPETRTIAFRADMDALPVPESNDFDFRSVNEGCSHACGHDGHMAIMLGLAQWIAQCRQPLPGTVKFIFQPAEEGWGGAVKMIEDGALEAPLPDNIFALHLWPDLAVGEVGVTTGTTMGSVDGFELHVLGKGGHSAMPHQTVDALIVAAHIAIALQSIVARKVDPLVPSVLTVTKIIAGTADNAIAEAAALRGLVRSFEGELREWFKKEIERCAKGVADSFDAGLTMQWNPMYPPTVNDAQAADLVRKSAGNILGADKTIHETKTMASEDMSFFLQKIPGCYFFLGAANPDKDINSPLHSPDFNFDEDAMTLGLAILADCLKRFFKV